MLVFRGSSGWKMSDMTASTGSRGHRNMATPLFPRPCLVEGHGPTGAHEALATIHLLHCGDARHLEWVPDASVHLVVASPPYWTLKRYREYPGQLGAVADYEAFLDELDTVWRHCARVLVPGGRLICVVGDVCLARRRNHGRHLVMPLHADISVRCRRLGLDYLTPIYWYKIANARYEVENGSSFLGEPYEPNAIIKNEVEYLLMLRKPGGYRTSTAQQRCLSKLTKTEHATWFRFFWTDIPGPSTRQHPAPFPVELVYRLIRMYSFVGDTAVDPFAGTCATTVAAMKAQRHSLANELDPEYFRLGVERVKKAADDISRRGGTPPRVEIHDGSRAHREMADGMSLVPAALQEVFAPGGPTPTRESWQPLR